MNSGLELFELDISNQYVCQSVDEILNFLDFEIQVPNSPLVNHFKKICDKTNQAFDCNITPREMLEIAHGKGPKEISPEQSFAYMITLTHLRASTEIRHNHLRIQTVITFEHNVVDTKTNIVGKVSDDNKEKIIKLAEALVELETRILAMIAPEEKFS